MEEFFGKTSLFNIAVPDNTSRTGMGSHKKAKGISQDPKATFQQNYDFPHMIVGNYERHARATGKTHKGKLRSGFRLWGGVYFHLP
jgi:hypothetical protein